MDGFFGCNNGYIQFTVMPTANIKWLNGIVQYTGETDTYIQGYFYICVNNGGVYSWEQINVQPRTSDKVVLLSITTAPAGSFVAGSKYYNDSDKKIYEAIANDTWVDAIETSPQFWIAYQYDGDYYLWDGDNLVETDLEKYEVLSNKTNDYSGTSTSLYISQKGINDGLATKQDVVTISTDTSSATPTLELVNYQEKRYTYASGLTSLDIDLPATIANDFNSAVVFKSGAVATVFTTDSSIKYSGDEVASNVFTPIAATTYNLMFWYDGINVNCVVRGV